MEEKKQCNSEYYESLSDEDFFAPRYTMSEEDQRLLEANSKTVNGRTFYRHKVLEDLERKYAALTNPNPGEPGTRENPIVRFGISYIYSERGHLIKYIGSGLGLYTSSGDAQEELTEAQKAMVIAASKMPISYDSDCPKSSPERLEAFRAYGRERNRRRELAEA